MECSNVSESVLRANGWQESTWCQGARANREFNKPVINRFPCHWVGKGDFAPFSHTSATLFAGLEEVRDNNLCDSRAYGGLCAGIGHIFHVQATATIGKSVGRRRVSECNKLERLTHIAHSLVGSNIARDNFGNFSPYPILSASFFRNICCRILSARSTLLRVMASPSSAPVFKLRRHTDIRFRHTTHIQGNMCYSIFMAVHLLPLTTTSVNIAHRAPLEFLVPMEFVCC